MKVGASIVTVAGLLACGSTHAQDYIGQLSSNPYAPDSTSNPYGAGNPYDSDSINNPYGEYGSPYSKKSVNNPYGTDAPKLYDREGNYRGKLSSNPYDPESISNPYGRYGNPYSSESINNPYGAGNPYASDSPTNPYGEGWTIIGQDDESGVVDSVETTSDAWDTVRSRRERSSFESSYDPYDTQSSGSSSFEPEPLPSFESSYLSVGSDEASSDMLDVPEADWGFD